jgi:hypothetical protein
MDVYHKVLVKLYEVTGGKDSEAVEFKDLVKNMGFLGGYPDIFKELSRQGWIAETRRPDVVMITHWGVKEAKKSGAIKEDVSERMQTVTRETNRLISNAKDFSIILGEFSSDSSKEKLKSLEKKFDELKDGIDKIKENIE